MMRDGDAVGGNEFGDGGAGIHWYPLLLAVRGSSLLWHVQTTDSFSNVPSGFPLPPQVLSVGDTPIVAPTFRGYINLQKLGHFLAPWKRGRRGSRSSVDDELPVREYIEVVLQNADFQTTEKVDVKPMVILLAEDEVWVQYFIWKLLKADGFTVLTGGNGAFALEASRNHPGPVDLLLTDMEMPRMGGLELAETIAAERPGTKVLIMSGDLSGREQASMNGLLFLQKPFTPTALRHSIEALLGPIPSLAGIYPYPSETTLTATSSQGHR